MKQVEEVLGLLMAAGMTLKLKKCHSFSESIDYLGHVIAPGKLKVAKATTEAIDLQSYQEDVSQMRSLLRLCVVNRHFVPGFAKNAATLNRKLKKGKPSQFVSDDRQHKAIDELKLRVVYPPVLALTRTNGKYMEDTNASDSQIGCVFLKEQENKVLKPICYW